MLERVIFCDKIVYHVLLVYFYLFSLNILFIVDIDVSHGGGMDEGMFSNKVRRSHMDGAL